MKPDFLPDELSRYDVLENDTDLFGALTKNHKDLFTYFEYGINDEPWARDHSKFIKLTMRWAAKQYYLGTLSEPLAAMMVKMIQDHISQLQPLLLFRPALFSTFRLQVNNDNIRVNSLLFGVCSPFFKRLFVHCYERWIDDWELPGATVSLFKLINEYINNGAIKDLWRLEKDEAFALMNQAKEWELHQLENECGGLLKRYFTRANVLKIILDAHRRQFIPYKNLAIEFFNQQEHGLKFITARDSDLKVELHDFKQETLDLFDEIASTATHLAFYGDLSNEPEFSQVIEKTPKLIGIDLSGSKKYAGQFSYLPDNLMELNLSACPWVKPEILQQVSAKFSSLKTLELASNVHLNFQAWGMLNRFRQLITLNLSRCHQISDDDLKLIQKACPNLIELNLEECRQVTNRGVTDLLTSCRSLISLDISRSILLTDKALFDIGVQGSLITRLNIMHSKGFTDKGLLQLLRLRSNLAYLNIKGCDFSAMTIARITEDYPFMTLED